MINRLAIVATHPIQYYAPVFRLLAEGQRISIKVFYTLGQVEGRQYDPGFRQSVEWDIPLLDGYPYEVIGNVAEVPGTAHFNGIVTPGLIGHIKEWKPDAVLVFGWAYQSHLKVIRYFHQKIPVYFRGDSTLLDEQGRLGNLLRKVLLHWVYRHVDHAFYVGKNNKAYFNNYGLSDNRLSFAPHAVDNERFGLDRKTEAAELRRQLNIADDHLLVLFAGKFIPKKDPLTLLEAFQALKRDDTHLLFAGDGELENILRSRAAGHTNIHFVHFQNQSRMPVIYQACDLFCLPSGGPGETWGLAVNEAMACGKAILVSDKCGCASDLVSPANGGVFPAGNNTQLTVSLAGLLKDKENLEKMGATSRKTIKSWNFTEIAKTIENRLIHETK